MSEKSEQYVEQILEAIKIIAQAESQANNQYDKTEICQISSIQDRKQGAYWVTRNGHTKFLAYCSPEEAKYQIDDYVRVSIPNGNYTDKKYIIGKAVLDQSKPVNYVSPLESILFPDNTAWQSISEGIDSIVPNGEVLNQPIGILSIIDQKYNLRDIYNVLGIKLKIKYNTTKKLISGEYGIEIRFNDNDKQIFRFSSSNMFGNPYSFPMFVNQYAKWNINPEWGDIKTLNIYLYQDNNFKYVDEEGNIQEWKDNNAIEVSSLELNFGGDINTIEDNVVKICPAGDKAGTSDYYIYKAGDLNRQVSLQWYNKNEDNEYLGYSDGRAVLQTTENKDKNETQYDEENKVIKHYSELDYLQYLDDENNLLIQQNANRPTDYLGLKVAAAYETALKQVNNITNKIDELIALIKNYRHLFSKNSGLNEAIERLIDDNDSSNEFVSLVDMRRKIETALSTSSKDDEGNTIYQGFQPDMSKALERAAAVQAVIIDSAITPESEAVDISTIKNLWETIECGVKYLFIPDPEEGKTQWQIAFLEDASLRPTTADIAQKKNLYLQINNFLNQNQEMFNLFNFNASVGDDRYDMSKTYWEFLAAYQSEDDIKELNINDIITIPFKSSLENVDFIEANANFYSCYWYQKVGDESGGDLLITDKTWTRVPLEDYINAGLPNKTDNNYLVTYPESQENVLFLPIFHSFKQTETFMAVLVYNHEVYKSNEITFINEANIIGTLETDETQGLKIVHGQNSQDAYVSYNQYNKLKDVGEATIKRYLKVRYEGETQGDEALYQATIYWYIPISNTMLQAAIDETEEAGLKKLESGDRILAGYDCYYREIQFNEDGTLNEDSVSFSYTIHRHYLRSWQNNTIQCIVVKANDQEYHTSKNISFSSSGTNGSPYTIIVEPALGFPYACVGNDWLPEPEEGDNNEKTYKLKITVFNDKEEICDISDSNISTSLLFQHGLELLKPRKQNEQWIQPIRVTKYRGGYGILKVSIDNIEITDPNDNTKVRYISISTLYAIPQAYSPNYNIQGIDSIVYSASGGLNMDIEDNISYKIFNNNQEVTEGITWVVNQQDLSPTADAFPSLNEQNILIPKNLYTNVLSEKMFYVQAWQKTEDINTGILLWTQPVIIWQDQFGSEFLNGWSGELVIDNENNTIMSTMVGAGIKNTENLFSGILMGQVSKTTDIIPPSMPEDYSASGIGLYGIHEGAFSYGFNIEGTAFLGKSGGGRIWFDGINGFIASGNWFLDENNEERTKWWEYIKDEQGNNTKIKQLKSGKQGMAIDLQNGHIDAYDFKLSSEGIQLNSKPSDNEYYFCIGKRNEEENDEPSYYLSFDANNKLDMQVSDFIVSTKHTMDENENATPIFFSSLPVQSEVSAVQWGGYGTIGQVQFQIGNNFLITSSGKVFATEIAFTNQLAINNGSLKYSPSNTTSDFIQIPEGNNETSSFRASLYYSNNKTKVANYGADTAWYNYQTPFTIKGEGAYKSLTLQRDSNSGGGSMEYFIIEQAITGDTNNYIIPTLYHGSLAKGQIVTLDLTKYNGTHNELYLIINMSTTAQSNNAYVKATPSTGIAGWELSGEGLKLGEYLLNADKLGQLIALLDI